MKLLYLVFGVILPDALLDFCCTPQTEAVIKQMNGSILSSSLLHRDLQDLKTPIKVDI